MSEIEIQNSICEYLTVKKHFFWRCNNVPIFDATKKTFRRMPKYSMKGVADIIILYQGRAIFLEVKMPKRYQSRHQKEFEKGVTDAGSCYHLVTSIDDVIKLKL